MQTLVATLDAGLHASLVSLLTVLQPGAQVRRVYNAPEIHAFLEGEAVSLAFIDANMIGYGEQFSAQELASKHPQTRFFVLGGEQSLKLNSVPQQEIVAAPTSAPASVPAPVAAFRPQAETNFQPLLVAAQAEQPDAAMADGPALTGRQADVLRLVREGKATKEIARQLGLAVPTVKTHLAALYRQLGVRNRVEAAMKQSAPAPSAVVRQFPTQRAADPAAVTRAMSAVAGLRAVG